MIEVCHSHINIHNYTLGDCKKLENFLKFSTLIPKRSLSCRSTLALYVG